MNTELLDQPPLLTAAASEGRFDRIERADSAGGDARSRAAEGRAAFQAFLDAARATFGHEGVTDRESAIRKGADELVAQAFFQPIFKMMREDPLRSEVIPISKGENLFGPLLDSELSKRIVEGERFPITGALVRSLLPAQMEAESAPSPAEAAPDAPDTRRGPMEPGHSSVTSKATPDATSTATLNTISNVPPNAKPHAGPHAHPRAPANTKPLDTKA